MSQTTEPQIVQRRVDELVPYARNARTHSDEQVAQIAASIREFGWTNPLLIDGDSGIIAGHGRVMAARKLGLEQVPCISLAGLSEAQRRAYVLADNKLPELAGWDADLLRIELADLAQEDFDIGLIGFDDENLDDVFGGHASQIDREQLDSDEGAIDSPEPASEEAKAGPIMFPVFAQLSKRDYGRWKTWRSGHGGNDTAALLQAIEALGC